MSLPPHLRDDAPHRQCDQCGRKTWDTAKFNTTCTMTQPSGLACGGTFRSDCSCHNARLSKMLFEAREQCGMWADVAEHRTGQPATAVRRLVAEIDAYRAERGWSPNGYGGEPTFTITRAELGDDGCSSPTSPSPTANPPRSSSP